jgi:hypothetical protein
VIAEGLEQLAVAAAEVEDRDVVPRGVPLEHLHEQLLRAL